MPLKADLDAIDWKILRELQDDGRMTNVELSRRVGISAPPCLRRLKRLENSGVRATGRCSTGRRWASISSPSASSDCIINPRWN